MSFGTQRRFSDPGAPAHEWVARIRAGDEAAFEAMFRAYYDELCRCVASYLGSRDAAEDVVQGVFARIWEDRERWAVSELRHYLYAAVRRRATSQHRFTSVRRRRATVLAIAQLDQAGTASPDALLEAEELRRRLERALGALPPRTRAAFLLSRRDGLSYREVATRMAISPKTVGVHIGRALAVLRKSLIPLAIVVSVALSLAYASEPSRAGWRLVWQDEFDGPGLDATKWVRETGGDGWGNAELQYYTNTPQNARIEDGNLVIEARREQVGGRDYTSARLKTEGRGSWKYGRVEARIRIPRGQGLWPAFWMLGDGCAHVGWPDCGEIDIMENIGKEPNRVHGTVHGPGYSGAQGVTSTYELSTGAFADAFHVYTIEWEPDTVRWYVDGTLYRTVTPRDVPGRWVFDHPFFIILNLAVGGHWPGNPDSTTAFPQTMQVDYVRVYQE